MKRQVPEKPTFAMEKHGYAPTLIIDVPDQSPRTLIRVINNWFILIDQYGDEILNHHTVHKKQKWFGLGYRESGALYSEQHLFNKLDYSLTEAKEKTIALVLSLIKLNKQQNDGIYTHSELETGSFAIKWLALNDIANLTLYVKYLKSIDLEHTVEQLSTIQELKRKYGLKKLTPLVALAEKEELENLLSYLA